MNDGSFYLKFLEIIKGLDNTQSPIFSSFSQLLFTNIHLKMYPHSRPKTMEPLLFSSQ